jgi:3'(2'), 5'-bisphosphate nucleotidase
MSSYQRELEVGLEAVRRAAKVCRSVQTGIGPDAIDKQDSSPVTIADFASQAIICRALKRAFPEDPIVGEEDSAELKDASGEHHLPRIQRELEAVGHPADPESIYESIDFGSAKEYSPRFWTLDPIDGTKGFLRGEQYAISLALVIEGKLQLGILGCPNLDAESNNISETGTLLYAIKGQGAFRLRLDDPTAEPLPIRVSSISDPAQTRLCESVESGHSSHSDSAQLAEMLGIAGTPRRLDSQAKYAIVASGEAELYLRLPTRPGYREKIWDHGGGVLIALEAGGRVTDALGQPLDFSQGYRLENNRGVIVSNGPLHDRVLQGLEQLGIRMKAL